MCTVRGGVKRQQRSLPNRAQLGRRVAVPLPEHGTRPACLFGLWTNSASLDIDMRLMYSALTVVILLLAGSLPPPTWRRGLQSLWGWRVLFRRPGGQPNVDRRPRMPIDRYISPRSALANGTRELREVTRRYTCACTTYQRRTCY